MSLLDTYLHDAQLKREEEMTGLAQLRAELDSQDTKHGEVFTRMRGKVYDKARCAVTELLERRLKANRKKKFYQDCITKESYKGDAEVIAALFAVNVFSWGRDNAAIIGKTDEMLKLFLVTRTPGMSFAEAHAIRAEYATGYRELVNAMIEATDVVEVLQEKGKSKQAAQALMYLLPEVEEKVSEFINDVDGFHYTFAPMVCKPRPHQTLTGEGGYLTVSSPLLKKEVKEVGGGHISAYRKCNADTNPAFFKAFNNAQEVPYKVSTQFVEVMKKLLEQGVNLAAISAASDDEVKLAEHGKLIETGIEAAERDALYPALYFPVFIDTRQRMYYYPNRGINLHGVDFQKNLVQYADKEQVTVSGLEVIYLAFGNALGFDKLHSRSKLKLAKRMFEENRDSFKEGVFDSLFDSEEPFTAIHIALELLNIEANPNHKTGIVLYHDARCSAVQFQGLLLKDKTNLEMTSVIPTIEGLGAPQTVKGMLGDRLPDAYTKASENGLRLTYEMEESELKQELLDNKDKLFTRKMFKKSTMIVSGYGAKDQTARKDFADQLNEMGLEVSKEALREFGDKALEAIAITLPASVRYRDGVRSALRGRNTALVAIHPMTGFPLCFLECKAKSERITFRDIRGKKAEFSFITVDKNKADTQATHRQAVPGVIHSCDAATLVKVRLMSGCPVTTIHDAVSMPVNHMHKLVPIVNEIYHDIGVNDYLGDILTQFGCTEQVEHYNTADIDKVLTSEHCFV